MRLFFCSTDVGCFEFLFTTDEQRATELLGIYIVLAKINPSKLWFTELTSETVVPAHRDHLREALSWGLEGFASYEDGKGWVIRAVQDEFDKLVEDAVMRIFQMRDLGEIEAFVLAADYDRALELFEEHLKASGGDPDAVLYREVELQHLDEPANDAVYEALDLDREGLVICDTDGHWAFIAALGDRASGA